MEKKFQFHRAKLFGTLNSPLSKTTSNSILTIPTDITVAKKVHQDDTNFPAKNKTVKK